MSRAEYLPAEVMMQFSLITSVAASLTTSFRMQDILKPYTLSQKLITLLYVAVIINNVLDLAVIPKSLNIKFILNYNTESFAYMCSTELQIDLHTMNTDT